MLCVLLALADEQDRGRVRELYELCHKDMLRYAMYHLKKCGKENPSQDAEDVVQEAWMRLIKYSGVLHVEWEEARIKAYVLTVVRNEVFRYVGQLREVEPLSEGVSDEDFVAELRIKERYREVVRSIKSLDEKYSIPMLHHYVQEQPVKEVAKQLGLPEKTVYTRLERGKKMLLKMLGEEERNGSR